MEFLKQLYGYFNIIRPKNLLVIGFTQLLLHRFLIAPYLDTVILKGHLLILFILDTMIIAATGYIINDIMNQNTDRVNKPEKTFIGNYITEIGAYIYYLLFIILGSLISVYLAQFTDNWKNIWIYPVAIWCMYLYSRFLKSTVLKGNIYVSLFVALVWGVIFFVESTGGNPLPEILEELCWMYMIIIFLLNLMREIVKDIEDIQGDLQSGVVTLPISAGIPFSKKIVTGIGFLLTIIMYIWILKSCYTTGSYFRWFMLGLISPAVLVVSVYTLLANEKHSFTKISYILKMIMVAGMLSIILIYYGI